MTIATAASLFTFTLEWILRKTFRQRLMHDADIITQPHYTADTEAAMPASAATDTEKAYGDDRKARLKALQNVVVSYTFEAGIIFHSKYLLERCIALLETEFRVDPCSCILITTTWPGLTFVHNFLLLQASLLELLWAYLATRAQYKRS